MAAFGSSEEEVKAPTDLEFGRGDSSGSTAHILPLEIDGPGSKVSDKTEGGKVLEDDQAVAKKGICARCVHVAHGCGLSSPPRSIGLPTHNARLPSPTQALGQVRVPRRHPGHPRDHRDRRAAHVVHGADRGAPLPERRPDQRAGVHGG